MYTLLASMLHEFATLQTMRSKAYTFFLSIFLEFLCMTEQEEPKEDFSHLPPNQQSKKLKEKLDDLNNLIDSEVKSK